MPSARAEHYRSRSLWLDRLERPLQPRPPLPGDRDCDVAIVGAGFTGLWTAYYLKRAQPDLRILVVEREIAGFGPAGRNGGWASAGIAGASAAYGLPPDSARIRRAVAVTCDAVDEIGRVVEAERIQCDFRKAGALVAATTPPQWQRLAVTAGGGGTGPPEPDGLVLSAAEARELVRVEGMLGAWYHPHAARLDPARLVRGLAQACERLGVTIHERTAASALERGRVLCDRGELRAEFVVDATESYATELPGQRLRFLPLYSLMIATAPLDTEADEALGWREGLLVSDRRHLFFYAQRTADGRIAIGGRGAPYRLRRPIDERNERDRAVRERLIATIAREFPVARDAEVTHHWGGPLAVPRDWSMGVRLDRATGVASAGGYTGHGVVASNVSGRTLADLILGVDSELLSMPWVGHASRRWEPEPIRFLASRAIYAALATADRYEDATDRSARWVRLVRRFMPPGS